MTPSPGLRILTQSTASDQATAWAEDNELEALRWTDIYPIITDPFETIRHASTWIGTIGYVKPLDLVNTCRSIDEDVTRAIYDFKLSNPVAFVREKTDATTKAKVFRLATPQHIADPLTSFEQYATANWDGENAEPITAGTLSYARHIMRLLPNTFGAPDIAPAADGSITLEWVPDDHHKLDRLFLDIGPGEEWRAYWLLHDGSYGRQPGKGYSNDTRPTLRKLFDDLDR